MRIGAYVTTVELHSCLACGAKPTDSRKFTVDIFEHFVGRGGSLTPSGRCIYLSIFKRQKKRKKIGKREDLYCTAESMDDTCRQTRSRRLCRSFVGRFESQSVSRRLYIFYSAAPLLVIFAVDQCLAKSKSKSIHRLDRRPPGWEGTTEDTAVTGSACSETAFFEGKRQQPGTLRATTNIQV